MDLVDSGSLASSAAPPSAGAGAAAASALGVDASTFFEDFFLRKDTIVSICLFGLVGRAEDRSRFIVQCVDQQFLPGVNARMHLVGKF